MNSEDSLEPFLSRARYTLSRTECLRRREITRAVMRFASVMAVNGARSVGVRATLLTRAKPSKAPFRRSALWVAKSETPSSAS